MEIYFGGGSNAMLHAFSGRLLVRVLNLRER